jgi:hypothetical protein
VKKRSTLCALVIGIFSICGLSQTAHANNLNIFGGSNIGSNEAGLAVAEYVIPMIAEIGPFFEWSRDTGTPDNRFFLGGVARLPTPWLNFFLDTRLGYNWNTAPIPIAGQNGFNFELGIGYRLVGTVVDVMPRIGFNAIKSNNDLPVVNLSVGLAFVL